MTIQWCRSCLMPNTRPRIVFDETGECNACLYAEERKTMDWTVKKAEFLELVDRKRKHPVYDCIVAFSGGKDSAAIAWRMKHELGLNPLLVCYGQMIWTDVGRRNFHRIADDGFDILYWRVNQDVCRKLARRFLTERFHIKNHYDSAVSAVPTRTAIQMGIPLVFMAEHGESTYGGLVLSEESRRTRDATEVLEHQVGDDARNWAVDGLTDKDIFPYIFPAEAEISNAGVEIHYWAYYFPWDIKGNADLMREKVDFEAVQPRSDGSPEGYDSVDDAVDGIDFWGMHLKFGFGRATRICSRLIQAGHTTREEGLKIVKQYDGEFPEMYLQEVLDYVGMMRDELMALSDKHRNPELWEQRSGTWQPRFLVK